MARASVSASERHDHGSDQARTSTLAAPPAAPRMLWPAWWLWALAIHALLVYALLRPGFRF